MAVYSSAFIPMKGLTSLFQFPLCISKIKNTMSYYAVAKGRNPGIYTSWNDCKSQVDRYSGAVYKKFSCLSEAKSFVNDGEYRAQPSRNNSRNPPNQNLITNGSRDINQFSTSTSNGLFEYDADGRVNIYTDGACISNGYCNAKAGLGVFFGDNHPCNVSKPVYGRVTNNNAEIQAVIEAARIALKHNLIKIRIHTDSEFLINCINKWMAGWKLRGWRTGRGQPVINREELEEMERVLASLDVVFNHVRGHVGIYGNEMADKLAGQGAEMY